MRELCLNFLNLKNYVHITKIESCNLYQSALTIFSQKVLGHLDFGMPGSWIWHQKSVFEGSVYWKIASKRCNAAIEMIFYSSERWGCIFSEFHITEPLRSPHIFLFCIHWTSYKIFLHVFQESFCLLEPRGSVRGSVQVPQKLNTLKIGHRKWYYTYNLR